jgi:hypothetical protein
MLSSSSSDLLFLASSSSSDDDESGSGRNESSDSSSGDGDGDSSVSIGSFENDDEDEYEQVFIESMQNVKDNEDVRDLWWCSDFALDYMLPILFYLALLPWYHCSSMRALNLERFFAFFTTWSCEKC